MSTLQFAKIAHNYEYTNEKREKFQKKNRNRLQFEGFFILLRRNQKQTTMKATEQTKTQVDRAIRKIAEIFPPAPEAGVMTDIHIRVIQETGELTAFDDDDNELTRCVVEQWIDNKDDDFYKSITPVIRKCIEAHKAIIEELGIIKPYAVVLEDDEKENIAELYVVDDDTVIIDPDLMQDLDKDLDDFLDKLLKD